MGVSWIQMDKKANFPFITARKLKYLTFHANGITLFSRIIYCLILNKVYALTKISHALFRNKKWQRRSVISVPSECQVT